METKQHWEKIYETKRERDVSWFEAFPVASVRMIEAAGLTTDTCVIDVGGGDSHLVDALASRGLDCLAVLDVSGAALQRARARLGDAAKSFMWIEADVGRIGRSSRWTSGTTVLSFTSSRAPRNGHDTATSYDRR